MPITALQALNSVAERRAIKSRLANGQEEVAELGVPEVHQEVRSPSVPGAESEGDSDEDQLSGWSKSSSPSAPGDQLPPDSSLEASVASPQVERRDSLAALGMNRGMLDDQTDSSRRTHDEISPLVASQLMADNASHDRELHANTSEQLIELSTGSSTLSGSRISQPLHQLEFHLRNAVSMNSAYSPAGQDAALVTKNTEEDFPSGLIHRNIDGELNSEEPNIHSVSQQSDMQGQMERPLFMDECSEEDDHSLESMVPIVVETGSPDQKLETSITPALPPPSTAPEAGQPLFQVKRTPYVDAEISKILQSRHSSRASSISGTDENAHHSARGPVSADDDMLSGSVVPSTHYSQIHPAGKVTSPPESGLDGSTDYVDLDDDALLDQQLHSEIDAHSQRSRSISPLKERAYGLVTGELEHELPLSLGRDPLHEIPPLAPVEDGEHGKRKAAELDQLSPFVTKRRKHIKAAPAFNFSQDNRQSQDPSLLARAHRRDFFTSRRLDTTTSTDKADENNTPKVEYARDSVGDGTQSWDLNPAHLVPMELDHHSCGTDTETLVSEAIPHKLNQHLAEQSSPLGSRFEISKKRRPATGISPAYSDSSKGSAGVRASTLPASKASPLAERSLYDVFTSTYQDYTGEFKHFLAMCYRIQALVQADRMEHRSLWDDFIVRHRTEYRDYLLDCTDRGEDPVAYEKFYGDEIEESKHTKRILTPASLKNFIASVAGASETDQHTRASTSPKKALDDTPSSVNPSVRRPTPKTTNQETIDLTVENRGSKDTLQSKSTPKQRRSLPWVESPNAAKVPSPSFTSKQTPTLPVSVQCSPSPHTPSHKSTAAQKAAQNPTSGRLRPGLDHPPTSSQLGEAHKQHPEANDSTRRLNRRESHPSSVAEWLDRSPSDTVSSPVSPSHNPTLNEGDEDRWYLDRNTPFKAFVREYAELKSVEGGLGEVDQEGILRTEMRQMDVLGWRL